MRKKEQGISLVFILIMSFVLMSIIMLLAYAIRLDSLTSKSLVEGLDSQSTAREYVETLLENNNVATLAESSGSTIEIDNIRHEIVVNRESGLDVSDVSDVHILTNARAGFSSNMEMSIYKLSHKMFDDFLNKKILEEDVFVVEAQNYDKEFYRNIGNTIAPVNVPYIDGSDLSSVQINASGSYEKVDIGYVGAFEISSPGQQLRLYDFYGNYKVLPSVGGHGVPHSVYTATILRDGVWRVVLIQVFTNSSQTTSDVIYASETTLDKLKTNLDQAYSDLTSFYASINSNALVDEAVFYDSLQGARLFLRKDYVDSNGNEQHLKDVYEYGVDAGLPHFTLVDSTPFDDETKRNGYLVHTIAMVRPNTHNVHDVLILTDTEDPIRNVSIDGVNYGIVYKKNNYVPEIGFADGEYILATINDNSIKFFEYDQSATNSANALVLLSTITGLNQGGADPEKIIIQYGYYFVITTKQIFVFDSNYVKFDEVDITSASDVEILYDGQVGQLYALPNALVCRLDNTCNTNDRVYLDIYIPQSMMRSRVFYSRIH